MKKANPLDIIARHWPALEHRDKLLVLRIAKGFVGLLSSRQRMRVIADVRRHPRLGSTKHAIKAIETLLRASTVDAKAGAS